MPSLSKEMAFVFLVIKGLVSWLEACTSHNTIKFDSTVFEIKKKKVKLITLSGICLYELKSKGREHNLLA